MDALLPNGVFFQPKDSVRPLSKGEKEMKYEYMLSPLKVGSLTLRNRIIMGAMGSATANEDATVSECERAYYAERAKGGVGLIITEVTRVNDKHGVMMPKQTSAADDKYIPGLRALADEVHFYDGAIFLQLHHPGRQGFCDLNGNEPMRTPSGVTSYITNQPCREMTNEEVKELVSDYIDAAERAKKAGIDGVELHCAHGYLLNQFLSPYTNKRTDEYGGSTLNRARVVKEIIEGIRERVGGDYPVIMRISVEEYLEETVFDIKEPGLHMEESLEIIKYLIPFGLDAINVSAGVYESQNKAWEPTSYPQGWKIPLAETVKKAIGGAVPVFGVGTIRDPQYAEKILAEGRVDGVVVSRNMLADPDWVNKAAEGREKDIRRCISCLNCMETMQQSAFTGKSLQCAVNARTCMEWFYNDIRRNGAGRSVAVVGGGPSGCEAARILAERGFRVTLFEKGPRLGGQLNLADKPPHKEKIDWLIEWFEGQLEKLGVDVRLNTPANVEDIRAVSPLAVFVGTGSEAVVPRSIPGTDGENVCTSTDILSGRVKLSGKNVAVIGSGMTGLETSELLAAMGNKVTIIEMADSIGPDAGWQNKTDVTVKLDACGTVYMPGHKLIKINSDSVTVEPKGGEQFDVPADHVVLSLGVRAQQETANELEKSFRVIRIGDTFKPGRIANAVGTAFAEAYRFN